MITNVFLNFFARIAIIDTFYIFLRYTENNNKRRQKSCFTIAYLGNGKSTNRYHLPFSRKTYGQNQYQKNFSPSKPVWETFEDIEYIPISCLRSLNDPEIQLVVITTPSQFHYEYGKMALEHGKNVLVEKPFAETSKEAEELFALAKRKRAIYPMLPKQTVRF